MTQMPKWKSLLRNVFGSAEKMLMNVVPIMLLLVAMGVILFACAWFALALWQSFVQGLNSLLSGELWDYLAKVAQAVWTLVEFVFHVLGLALWLVCVLWMGYWIIRGIVWVIQRRR